MGADAHHEQFVPPPQTPRLSAFGKLRCGISPDLIHSNKKWVRLVS